MTDSYVYAIVALLPLSALMVIIQGNPYQALVIRGILGAVAALVYAVLGGADVALTEALVGTMLAVTLYAVAVRSSLVMRLGIVEGTVGQSAPATQPLIAQLRGILNTHHLRLELVPYADETVLAQALHAKEIHGILVPPQPAADPDAPAAEATLARSLITLRVPRLYEILNTELPPGLADLQDASHGAIAPPVPSLLTEKSL